MLCAIYWGWKREINQDRNCGSTGGKEIEAWSYGENTKNEVKSGEMKLCVQCHKTELPKEGGCTPGLMVVPLRWFPSFVLVELFHKPAQSAILPMTQTGNENSCISGRFSFILVICKFEAWDTWTFLLKCLVGALHLLVQTQYQVIIVVEYLISIKKYNKTQQAWQKRKKKENGCISC